MAKSNIKGITIEVVIDTEQAVKAIKELLQAVLSNQEQMENACSVARATQKDIDLMYAEPGEINLNPALRIELDPEAVAKRVVELLIAEVLR